MDQNVHNFFLFHRLFITYTNSHVFAHKLIIRYLRNEKKQLVLQEFAWSHLFVILSAAKNLLAQKAPPGLRFFAALRMTNKELFSREFLKGQITTPFRYHTMPKTISNTNLLETLSSYVPNMAL